MDLASLGFEIERRVIIFHRDVSLADETQLGYIGDPNNVVNGHTQGETLLYNCPSGTIFLDKGVSPYKVYQKVEDIAGGLQISNSNIIDNTSVDVDYITVNAGENIGGGRVVIIFNNEAMYADNTTNYFGQIGITLNSATINNSVKVKLYGLITDPSFNFVKGPIYLSNNGLMTQVEPINNTSVVLGYSQNSTSFIIKTQTIIER